EKKHSRRGFQGHASHLSRRREDRRQSQHRRGHHHLQLRRFSQVSNHHRQRYRAGGSRSRRRRGLRRRRLHGHGQRSARCPRHRARPPGEQARLGRQKASRTRRRGKSEKFRASQTPLPPAFLPPPRFRKAPPLAPPALRPLNTTRVNSIFAVLLPATTSLEPVAVFAKERSVGNWVNWLLLPVGIIFI